MLGRLLRWAGILAGAVLATPRRKRRGRAAGAAHRRSRRSPWRFPAWMDIARARRAGRCAEPLGGRQDDPRPARRHHRPRPGFAEDRPQPAAASGRGAASRRPGHRRPWQSRGDEPARRQPLHDAGRICRVRRRPVAGPPRAALHAPAQAARSRRSRQSPAHSVAGPRAMAGARLRSAGSSTRLAWSPSGELGRWAARNPAIAKVGDTLFVHGGISAEYAKLTLDEVNRRVARGDGRRRQAGPARCSRIRSARCGIAASSAPTPTRRRRGSATRPPALPPRPGADERPSRLWREASGHRPHAEPCRHRDQPDGRLARIDTGISRFYGGPVSWLEIVGDRMIPHTVRRSGR